MWGAFGGKGDFGGKGWGAFGGKGAWDGGKGAWGMPSFDPWGGKGGGKGGWEEPAKTFSPPKVYTINCGDTALTQQGYGPEAPALVFEKGNEAFSAASHLLQDCLENPKEDIEIIDDPDWEQFPEIGEAIKAATKEEHCFSIGICASKSLWAIGCGAGKAGRERAVKAALGVAFAMADLSVGKTLAKNYPEFGAVLRKKGLKVGGGGGGAWHAQSAGGLGDMYGLGGGKGKWGGGGGKWGGGDQEWSEPQLSGTPPKMHMLSAPDSKLTTEGYPAEGPAVVHGGKVEKPYFSCAHFIMSDQVEEIEEVTFEDDGDGELFPELYQALIAAGSEECGFCVAMCPSKAVWGLGVAFGAANRKTAAKMALGVAMAQSEGKIDAVAKNYPEFGELCATAGLCQAQKKRRKY